MALLKKYRVVSGICFERIEIVNNDVCNSCDFTWNCSKIDITTKRSLYDLCLLTYRIAGKYTYIPNRKLYKHGHMKKKK